MSFREVNKFINWLFILMQQMTFQLELEYYLFEFILLLQQPNTKLLFRIIDQRRVNIKQLFCLIKMLLKSYICSKSPQLVSTQSTPGVKRRQKFTPFINQRDGLGNIIQTKTRTKSRFEPQQIFQNLKKSTRQYFFERMYRQLVKRNEQSKLQLKQRNINIDACINKCYQSLRKQNKNHQKQNSFYYQLRQKMDHHVNALKYQIKGKKSSHEKIGKRAQSQKCFKRKKINEDLFSKSPRSKFMATFTNLSNQYRQLIQKKVYDPQLKWYQKKQMEVFPGKKFTGKILQKDLYQCI